MKQSDLIAQKEEITTLTPFRCEPTEEIENLNEYQKENGIKQPLLNKNFRELFKICHKNS